MTTLTPNRTPTTRTPRWLRTVLSLLVLSSLVYGLPGLARAYTFTGFEGATLVLGQPDLATTTNGSGPTGVSDPREVAVDPTTGKVFVLDLGNNRVLRFAAGAALTNGAAAEAVLGQPDLTSTSTYTTTQSGFLQPMSLHVDGSGRLWVADTNNNRVLRFDNASTKASGANADGVLGQPDFTTRLFFPFSPTQNTFQPHHVYVDGIGRLWVADTNNYRVLRFDNAATKANGANADGVLGQLDFTSDQGGTHPATWMTPTSVYVDGSGRLWVADQLNSRVLRFDNAATKANGADPDGVLGQPDFNIHLQITSDPLYQPVDITGDSTGRVFITTYTTGLHIFDNAAAKPNGAAADVTHDFSYSDLGCFFDPAADVLWVAGYGNRVLRFGVPSNPLSAPVISTPAAGAVITNPRPVITGTGEISATITVTEGATSICTAVDAADSTWTCTPGAD